MDCLARLFPCLPCFSRPQTNRYEMIPPPYTPDTMPHGSAVSPIINPVQGLGIPSPTHNWETARVRPLSENWELNWFLNYKKTGLLELKSLYSFDESDDHPLHQLASKFDEIWRFQESLKKEFGGADLRDIINTMLTRADIDEVLVPRLSPSGELVVTVKIKAHDNDTHIIKHFLFDKPIFKQDLFLNLCNLHNGNIFSSILLGSENDNSDFDITKPWKSLIDLVRDDFIQSFSTDINELRFPAQHPIRQFCLDLETVFTTQDNALKDSPGHTIHRLIQTKVTQKNITNSYFFRFTTSTTKYPALVLTFVDKNGTSNHVKFSTSREYLKLFKLTNRSAPLAYGQFEFNENTRYMHIQDVFRDAHSGRGTDFVVFEV